MFLLGTLPSPRLCYTGDLKVEHFSTPRKAKRHLDMLTDVINTQRKKVKVLQIQKRRLEKRIHDFKDLLQHLADVRMISEEVHMELMVCIF